MGRLEAIAQENGLPDLQALSAASGVSIRALRDLDQGYAVPDPAHEAAIRKCIKVPDNVLYSHGYPNPKTYQTRPGRLPDGARSLIYIKARDVQVGDYLAYHADGRRNQWVRVSGEPDLNVGFLMRVDIDGYVLTVNPNQMVRVARPSA